MLARHSARLSWITLVLPLALASAASAAEQRLELEPAATEVTFDLEATGHDVHGTLYLQRGVVVFDPETGTAAGEIAIDARRAETGSKKRDRDMHHKVLESDKYPLFLFTAESVEGRLGADGGSDLALSGTLTVHGDDHPLTLPAHVERSGDGITAQVDFVVPYVEWGMHNPSLLFLRVAEEVSVHVEAQGRLDAVEERMADVGSGR